MLSVVVCATLIGIEALLVKVEVDLSRGLPAFDIVGLPDTAVRESRERVRAAIKNSGYEFPVQRITINLAPADVKKIGPHYDLPIALGILTAKGLINSEKLNNYLIAGELSLSGKVRSIKGTLPMAIKAREEGLTGIIIPESNYGEARLVKGLEVVAIKSLNDLVEQLNTKGEISKREFKIEPGDCREGDHYRLDFNEVKGQKDAKRALEVAAAGYHNVVMVGPPGTGKTMLAKRFRTIMPPLTDKEALEITKIYSTMGLIKGESGLINRRPFRAPHHSISTSGLIGGGRIPAPGEISLAHLGTLFLDELPEFRRDVLEMLRQPLEDGEVTIVRTAMSATFPACFMLIAAMNPCPCGYYGDKKHECICTTTQISRYRARVSGPLLDRIDIHIELPALTIEELTGDGRQGESSLLIKKRVIMAQQHQLDRYRKENFNFNSHLRGKKLDKYCSIGMAGQILLKRAIEVLGLSARAYHRILRLARTIADLDHQETIKKDHLAEAIQYRSLDRRLF